MRRKKGLFFGSNNGNTTHIFSFYSTKNITGDNNVDWSMRLGGTFITALLICVAVFMFIKCSGKDSCLAPIKIKS